MNKDEMPVVKFSCDSSCGMRKKYPYSCNGDSCNYLIENYKSYTLNLQERIAYLESQNKGFQEQYNASGKLVNGLRQRLEKAEEENRILKESKGICKHSEEQCSGGIPEVGISKEELQILKGGE